MNVENESEQKMDNFLDNFLKNRQLQREHNKGGQNKEKEKECVKGNEQTETKEGKDENDEYNNFAPAFSLPLSEACKTYYGLTRPNKEGVWVGFREVRKHVEEIVPANLRQRFEDRTKKVCVCVICEVDWLANKTDVKRCWLSYSGSTGNMNTHMKEKHERDVRFVRAGVAEKAGIAASQSTIKWAIASEKKLENTSHTKQERVNRCLALCIAENNLSFKVRECIYVQYCIQYTI